MHPVSGCRSRRFLSTRRVTTASHQSNSLDHMALFTRGGRPSPFRALPHSLAYYHTVSSQLPRFSTMDAKSQKPKGRDATLSTLNLAIDALNILSDVSGIEPAKIAFSSVSALLTMIRVCFLLSRNDELLAHVYPQDSMINEQEYIEIGLSCADICKALDRGMNGKKLDDLSQSAREAINQLTTYVNQVVHGLDGSLTTEFIAGLWRRFKGRLSNKVGGAWRLDSSTQGAIRTRLLVGSWN